LIKEEGKSRFFYESNCMSIHVYVCTNKNRNIVLLVVVIVLGMRSNGTAIAARSAPRIMRASRVKDKQTDEHLLQKWFKLNEKKTRWKKINYRFLSFFLDLWLSMSWKSDRFDDEPVPWINFKDRKRKTIDSSRVAAILSPNNMCH